MVSRVSMKSTERRDDNRRLPHERRHDNRKLQGGMKNDESMTSAGIAEERQVKRRTSEPCSEISGIDEVKFSDVTAHIESASRRPDERMEVMMKQTSEVVLQSVNAQINGINSTINEMGEEREDKLGKIDERFTALEARWKRLRSSQQNNSDEQKS